MALEIVVKGANKEFVDEARRMYEGDDVATLLDTLCFEIMKNVPQENYKTISEGLSKIFKGFAQYHQEVNKQIKVKFE